MANTDAWELGSGLREDAVMTIDSAYFGTTADYMDGKVTLLTLVGHDENSDTMTEKLSVGGGWVSSDGGKTITHPTKSRVDKNSMYGHWITFCKEIPELFATLVSRGNPNIAAIWDTLILHLRATEIKFGKSLDSRERLMPVEFLGIADHGTPTVAMRVPSLVQQPPQQIPNEQLQFASVSTTMSPAEAIAAARAARTTTPTSPLLAQLTQLAQVSDNHTDFVTKAFQIDEVLSDEDLAMQVADANLLYAQVKGK